MACTATVEIKVRLFINLPDGVTDPTETMQDLDYTFKSNTPGTVIAETEIVDYETLRLSK